MANNKNILKHKIKHYHIILLSIILCPLLIINSNKVLEKRTQEQLVKKSERAIKQNFLGRYLLTFDEGVEKICLKGSKELKNYYVSKVDNTLNLDEEEEEDNGETPEYINSLIDVIKGTTGKSENEMTDNLMTYGKHLIWPLIGLAMAILAIPGWIICCSCCCCNCCCCCCCNKPSCKLPFFIVTICLYALASLLCLYGLTKSNSIFRGLADTECSILQFFNETISGEAKDEKPKWAGIEGIKSLLDTVNDRIDHQGENTLTDLNSGQTAIERVKGEFATLLEEKSSLVTGGNKVAISGTDYQLDIASLSLYGNFNHETKAGSGFVAGWYNEYKLISDELGSNINQAISNFQTLVRDASVKQSINEIKDSIDEIGKSINEVKDSMSDTIVKYSDYIDEKGKFGFKVFFGALVCIVVVIAVLMILLVFCSGKLCNKCCFFRCGFKLLIHLFWNILALLMIFTFFIGFIFTFIGTLGKDLTFVVNYFIGAENMNQEEPALFGSEGKKLSICFNGNGNFLTELENDGLVDLSKLSFDELNGFTENIKSAEDDLKSLKNHCITYNEMINQLRKRVNYEENFAVISSGDSLALQDLFNSLNDEVSPDEWAFNCNNRGNNCHTLKGYTMPNDLYSDKASAIPIVEKITKIQELVNLANSDTSPSYKKVTEEIKSGFDDKMDEEIGILKTFRENVDTLAGIFDEYIGENGGFSDFVNCNFIATNIRVILRNLRKGVGNTFYILGLCFLLSGCSLAIAIVFTILLVVIINKSVDKNKI